MEDSVWRTVLKRVPVVAPPSGRFVYSDRDIALVGLWAILHDRPFCWACDAGNWSPSHRPARLPHPSTVSRRWRQVEKRGLLRRTHQASLATLGPAGRYGAMDGRPLRVGGSSKDTDARAGRAVGGMGRGDKLHALIDARRVFVCYEVRPLCVAEQTVGRRLLRQAPAHLDRVVADTLYDSTPLHRVATACHRKLYTPLRENRVGRRQQPHRLRLLRLGQRSVGKRLLHWRDEIERAFGQSSTIGFGFKGLPSWARRSWRVTRWVWGKIVLYHAWLIHKQHAA